MRCNNCGWETPEGSQKCETCGPRLQESSQNYKQCPNGHYYKGDECPYCIQISEEKERLKSQLEELRKDPPSPPPPGNAMCYCPITDNDYDDYDDNSNDNSEDGRNGLSHKWLIILAIIVVVAIAIAIVLV